VTGGESTGGGPAERPLRPTLGLLDATAVGIGAIIFVVTGIAAAHAGPALAVSTVAAAGVSLLTALSFAQLTAWTTSEGSVYEFAHRLLSPFAGFATGWIWIVSNTFAGAAVAPGARLFYYGIANVCALRLDAEARRYPRLIPALGVASCLLFFVAILFVSPRAWLVGTATLAVGSVYYLLRHRA
jgi:amino acid transporter